MIHGIDTHPYEDDYSPTSCNGLTSQATVHKHVADQQAGCFS